MPPKPAKKPLLPTIKEKSVTKPLDCKLLTLAILLWVAAIVLACFTTRAVYAFSKHSQTIVKSYELLDENCYFSLHIGYEHFQSKRDSLTDEEYAEYTKIFEKHALKRHIYYNVEPQTIMGCIFVFSMLYIIARSFYKKFTDSFLMFLDTYFFVLLIVFLFKFGYFVYYVRYRYAGCLAHFHIY